MYYAKARREEKKLEITFLVRLKFKPEVLKFKGAEGVVSPLLSERPSSSS
jgi:hypothetical protein